MLAFRPKQTGQSSMGISAASNRPCQRSTPETKTLPLSALSANRAMPARSVSTAAVRRPSGSSSSTTGTRLSGSPVTRMKSFAVIMASSCHLLG
jgi:hypothetical protein